MLHVLLEYIVQLWLYPVLLQLTESVLFIYFWGRVIVKMIQSTFLYRSEFLLEGYCNKVPKTEWLKQKCIVSQLWRLEILEQGVIRALFFPKALKKHLCQSLALLVLCLWQYNSKFLMAFSVRACLFLCPSFLPFFEGTSLPKCGCH